MLQNIHLDELLQIIKLHAFEIAAETAKDPVDGSELQRRAARLQTVVDEYRKETRPRMADTQQIDMGFTGCL